MTEIKILDVNRTGSPSLVNSESYLNELAGEESQIKGGNLFLPIYRVPPMFPRHWFPVVPRIPFRRWF